MISNPGESNLRVIELDKVLVDVEDAQFPSCQIAMVVLASSGPEAVVALGISS